MAQKNHISQILQYQLISLFACRLTAIHYISSIKIQHSKYSYLIQLLLSISS